MPEITIDVDVKCYVCNNRIEASVLRGDIFEVEPCEYCLESEYERGADKAYELGHTEGYNLGKRVGFEEGEVSGA